MPLILFIVWGYTALFSQPEGTISRELQGPFEPDRGYSWLVSLPEFSRWADSQSQPENSTLIMFEDGKPLGLPHSLHDNIRNQGQGRFSHWGGKLYFSASDNSNPNKNGRKYSITITPTQKAPVRTLVYLFLAFGLSGGVAGLGLMTIYTRNPLAKKWLYFLAVSSLSIIAVLYGNIVPPLKIWGRACHLLIFVWLLVALSSIFVIFHEVKAQGLISDRKKWIFPVLAIWSSIGIIILLFEVFFRIFPIYDTSALNPGVKFFWPDYVNHPLNNMGYRDRPFALEKAPHTYRILVVGDSYTEGAGCRREECFPGVLEGELNHRLKNAGCPNQVEVYGLGRCGANTVEEVQAILKQAPILKPDLIILAYVLNDPEVHPPDLKLFDPPAWVAAIHKIFLEEIRSYAYYWIFSNFTLFPGSIPPGGDYHILIHSPDYHGWKKADEAVHNLSEFTKKNNIKLVGIIFPLFAFDNYPAKYKNIHMQVMEMMQHNDIEAIDLLEFYEKNNKDLRVFAFSKFDAHPNQKANKILGQFLAGLVWEKESFKPYREKCRSN